MEVQSRSLKTDKTVTLSYEVSELLWVQAFLSEPNVPGAFRSSASVMEICSSEERRA